MEQRTKIAQAHLVVSLSTDLSSPPLEERCPLGAEHNNDCNASTQMEYYIRPSLKWKYCIH